MSFFTADSISGRSFQGELIALLQLFLHGCLGYKHSQCILRAGFSFCSFMVGWRAVSKEKQWMKWVGPADNGLGNCFALVIIPKTSILMINSKDQINTMYLSLQVELHHQWSYSKQNRLKSRS